MQTSKLESTNLDLIAQPQRKLANCMLARKACIEEDDGAIIMPMTDNAPDSLVHGTRCLQLVPLVSADSHTIFLLHTVHVLTFQEDLSQVDYQGQYLRKRKPSREAY